jgi:hypothetical protein
VTICPCCGFKFEGDLRDGCESCGARAVGSPLPRPERELPAYGRTLLLVVTGTLVSLGFLVQTIIAFAERTPQSFGFWSWMAAGETAAWRIKWIAIPVMFVLLWIGRRVYRSMLRTPERFAGLAMARRGLLASAIVALLFVTMIGVTVPARLRQRQDGIRAGLLARGYTYHRAVLDYQAKYGVLPTEPKDLMRLPDPDGSIAAAIADIEPSWYQKKFSTIVENGGNKRTKPGFVIKTSSITSVDAPAPDLSATNYELRLPGEDKVINNDDDLIVRDGVILTVAQSLEKIKPAATTARAVKH